MASTERAARGAATGSTGDAAAPAPELDRLADATRRMAHRVVRTDAPGDALDRASELVETALGVLGTRSVLGPRYGSFLSARDDPAQFTPFSPVRGALNPIAPPVRVWVDDGVVQGHANFGPAYEGPPGCVHGGVIAAVFDDILGFANVASGLGAMTATLSISYRSPTPLDTDLRITARQVGRDGKKVFTTGTIHAGERLCAECDGLFIAISTDHLREPGGSDR